MTNQYSLGSPRAEQLLESARGLQPVLRERAAQCKEERKVPDATIADFQAAGFFKLLQAEQYGGYAMDPQVFYAVGGRTLEDRRVVVDEQGRCRVEVRRLL